MYIAVQKFGTGESHFNVFNNVIYLLINRKLKSAEFNYNIII